MMRVLVIGLGRFGQAVAVELAETGAEVIAVDESMDRVEALRDRVAVAAQVDSVEPEALRAVGAADVDAAVVAIGADFAVEVLSVAVLKELGVKLIVAQASTEREGRILELVGATRVVAVDAEMGQRVARSLLGTDVLDQVSLGGGMSVIHWTADERVVGKPLGECRFREDWRLGVVGVRRGGQESADALPAPDYVFEAGDVVLLAGHDARLRAFTK